MRNIFPFNNLQHLIYRKKNHYVSKKFSQVLCSWPDIQKQITWFSADIFKTKFNDDCNIYIMKGLKTR